METNPNPDLELVHVAIQRLLEDKKEEEEEQKRKRPPQASGELVSFERDGDDDHLLLSKLLSQVESIPARCMSKSMWSLMPLDYQSRIPLVFAEEMISESLVVDTELVLKFEFSIKSRKPRIHEVNYVRSSVLNSALSLEQVESLKASRAIEKPEASADTGVAVDEDTAKSDATVEAVGLEGKEGNGGGETEATPEEIVRELKKVKRQNAVTHWLLSAMIVLTLAWQLSEVSLILKVREGLGHPFRSIGSAITNFFKSPSAKGRDDADEDADRRQSETMGIPPLQVPELPHFDAPDLIPNGENHSPASV